jgi:hypothetical protein
VLSICFYDTQLLHLRAQPSNARAQVVLCVLLRLQYLVKHLNLLAGCPTCC